MAKPQQRTRQTRRPSSVKTAGRKRTAQTQWLKWGIGAAVVFVIGVMIWTAVTRASGPPASAVRAYEEYAGVTGSSYNAGSTTQRYPDPGKKGKGVQWLPALGDAPVVVIEFSDIYCGHCRVIIKRALDALRRCPTGGAVCGLLFGFAQSMMARWRP